VVVSAEARRAVHLLRARARRARQLTTCQYFLLTICPYFLYIFSLAADHFSFFDSTLVFLLVDMCESAVDFSRLSMIEKSYSARSRSSVLFSTPFLHLRWCHQQCKNNIARMVQKWGRYLSAGFDQWKREKGPKVWVSLRTTEVISAMQKPVSCCVFVVQPEEEEAPALSGGCVRLSMGA